MVILRQTRTNQGINSRDGPLKKCFRFFVSKFNHAKEFNLLLLKLFI